MKSKHHIKSISFASSLLMASLAGADSVKSRMAKGDLADLKFAANAALQEYLPAEKLEPNNVPLLLRIARQYRHLMTDATTPEEKLRLGGQALIYGLRAAALAPADSEAQLSPAITYGKMLAFQGSKERAAASPLIKAAADKAIKLDPKNDVAWHVLGRWHQALADLAGFKRTMAELLYGSLPTSTNEEAIACFEKALALSPTRLRHYIELGRTYAQMGKTSEARTALEKGISMPNLEKDDAEMKLRGTEALDKLPK
jgi:tetratricopeptide (TPR) repeat protein